MKPMITPRSQTWLAIMVVVVSAFTAIMLHAALPVKVDESLLDGLLVQKFGFPVVAVAYFLVLFAHCAVVLILNRNRLMSSQRKPGIHFGLSFSLLYMIGMQEIVLGASPFSQWGTAFVYYQLWMGIGDAIPAILLCLLIAGIFFREQKKGSVPKGSNALLTILLFSMITGTIRLIASLGGAIKSDIPDYSVPVTLWGYLLGFVFGIAYLLVENTTRSKVKTMLLGIGGNWMIFNSFIGLIRKDAMGDALLRGAIDLAAIAIAMKLLSMMKKPRLAET